MVGSMMFFLWMISIGISLAQDESDETIEKAKQAYKYGEQLFKEGNYPEAIKAFERAYGMTNRYQLLFNLALSHQFSADLEQARYYFEEYQRLAPAEQWNEAQQRIDNIDAILASKEVEEEAVENVVSQKEEKILPSWISPALWSMGTIGAAGGLYFGIKSQSESNSIQELCVENLCTLQAKDKMTSARTSALIADVAWGVGIGAIGSALWIHFDTGQAISFTSKTIVFKGEF